MKKKLLRPGRKLLTLQPCKKALRRIEITSNVSSQHRISDYYLKYFSTKNSFLDTILYLQIICVYVSFQWAYDYITMLYYDGELVSTSH